MLYIVPTPIGNLKDITYRAVEVLQTADILLCEDTRTSKKLLDHYHISKPLVPFHQHNEHRVVLQLSNELAMGKVMALLSDAGTPGISDAAYLLVKSCIEKNIAVTCLPGATAFVPALVASGFPIHPFVFMGFLPIKKGKQTCLKKLAVEDKTVVFYESNVRIAKTLRDCIAFFGKDRKAVVAREISKWYENYHRGTLEELVTLFEQEHIKGEMVVIIEANNIKQVEE